MNPKDIRKKNLEAAVTSDSEWLTKFFQDQPSDIQQRAKVSGCLANGYAPPGYGLADFTIVRHEKCFHLFHIPRVPGNRCADFSNEHWLGHAVSSDLDTWVTGNPSLSVEPAHYYESAHIWAPFVFEENGSFLMFYTGLSAEPSQVLCMARAQDTDLNIWEREKEKPLIPLQGFDWHWRNEQGHVRHARDPHVVKIGSTYFLAYTGMHRNGCPVVGGLVSTDLQHWEDIGPILYRPMTQGRAWLPESVNIQPLPEGQWALMPSMSPGLEYYISNDPFHWHGIQPKQIKYLEGNDDEPVGIEILANATDGRWLAAFFEKSNNRLFIGEIDRSQYPWTLSRLRNLSPENLSAYPHGFL